MPAITTSIKVPAYPRFMPTPNHADMQLYITCTQPLALIWVCQTTPAQLYIVAGPQSPTLLKDCAEWYRAFAANQLDKN